VHARVREFDGEGIAEAAMLLLNVLPKL